MGNLKVGKDDRVDLKKLLHADDMLISGADIAFAGMAIGDTSYDARAFASYLISVAHIVTRIVLSDKLIFAYSPGAGAEEPPTSHLLPLLEQHCNTIQIDQDNELISAVVEETMTDSTGMFGEELPKNTLASAKAYAPWAGPDLGAALLAEYAVANLLNVPFAPNPILSHPISTHSLRGRTSDEEMLRYVEDLRRETSQEMNLHKELSVYDLNVPAIFGAVLKKAKDPREMILIAAQMNADAKPFRTWCCNLESKEQRDPKTYLDQIAAAKASLGKLGKRIAASGEERMQLSVCIGPLSFRVPSPSVKKLIDRLDVDVRFYRPRNFLLNLLSSSRQVTLLALDLARVFALKPGFAREASNHFTTMALNQQASYEAGSKRP